MKCFEQLILIVELIFFLLNEKGRNGRNVEPKTVSFRMQIYFNFSHFFQNEKESCSSRLIYWVTFFVNTRLYRT